jgi:DNA-binding MarR family transcriptional regulator
MLDAPEMTGALLRTASRAMVEGAEAQMQGSGIRLSQWLALKLLGSQERLSGSDLWRELGMNAGAMTRLLDTLEDIGLIERLRSRSDRRVVNVSITPAGANLVAELRATLSDFWTRSLQGFADEERRTLNALLTRLGDAFSTDGR